MLSTSVLWQKMQRFQSVADTEVRETLCDKPSESDVLGSEVFCLFRSRYSLFSAVKLL